MCSQIIRSSLKTFFICKTLSCFEAPRINRLQEGHDSETIEYNEECFRSKAGVPKPIIMDMSKSRSELFSKLINFNVSTARNSKLLPRHTWQVVPIISTKMYWTWYQCRQKLFQKHCLYFNQSSQRQTNVYFTSITAPTLKQKNSPLKHLLLQCNWKYCVHIHCSVFIVLQYYIISVTRKTFFTTLDLLEPWHSSINGARAVSLYTSIVK